MKRLRFLSFVLLLLILSGQAIADPADSLHDGYSPPGFQALSKLYWAIGKFDINDNTAIDGFLAINNCDIFQKYYHNDLQWNTIREATRQRILREVAAYPTRFEIVIPVKLGRYDSEKQQFEVAPESSLNGARKFDVAYNPSEAICGMDNGLKGYPINIILTLSRPFDFKVLPASLEVAAAFINDTQKQLDNTPLQEHVRSYERDVYLRMKVHIVQYKDDVTEGSGGLRALVFGRLEGFEVYADPDREKLLYKQEVTDDKLYRHVREPAAAPEPVAAPAPVTPAPVAAPPPAPAVSIPAYQPPGDDEGVESATPPDAAKP